MHLFSRSCFLIGCLAVLLAPLAAQRVSIDYVLRTEKGLPIVGGMLVVGVPGDFDEGSFAAGSKSIVARSDAKGRIRASLLAPADGVHRYAWLSAPGRARRWMPWSTGDGQARLHRGTAVLVQGVDIKGLVLGADGKPFAGAHVRGRDVLAGGALRQYSQTLMPAHFATFARSDARGRFQLAGALPLGVSVTAHAPGHYVAREGFANAHRPLVLRLRKGGFVAGRVLDSKGRPVDALVRVRHVAGVAPLARARTDAQGGYRCNLDFVGRYRVEVDPRTAHVAPGAVLGPVLTAPKAGVEVKIPPAKLEDVVRLRVVDAASGKPVREGRAEVSWLRPANYTAPRVPQGPGDWRPLGPDGAVVLPGPRSAADGDKGVVYVSAPGYASRCQGEVAPGKALVVAMQRASSIRGLVVDGKGRPVAGAQVVRLGLRRIPGVPPFGLSLWNSGKSLGYVLSGEDGGFRIDQLSAGAYQLHVRHPNHADGRVARLEVGEGKEETVKVVLPKGVPWSGSAGGTGGRLGLTLLLRRENRGFRGIAVETMFRGPAEPRARIDAEGRFAFPPLQPGRYTLLLRADRARGFSLRVNRALRVVRVGKGDTDVRLDLSEDVPGVLAGRVDFAGSVLPPGRLAVVATELTVGSVLLQGLDSLDAMLGHRAAISPQRGFRVELPPGRYHCGLIDLETGLVLHRTRKPIQVLGGLTETWVSRPDLAPVRLTWDGSEDPVTRLRFGYPGANGLFELASVRLPDLGDGVLVRPDQRELTVYLPLREVKVELRNEEYLLEGEERKDWLPLTEKIIEPERGKMTRAHLSRDG